MQKAGLESLLPTKRSFVVKGIKRLYILIKKEKPLKSARLAQPNDHQIAIGHARKRYVVASILGYESFEYSTLRNAPVRSFIDSTAMDDGLAIDSQGAHSSNMSISISAIDSRDSF